MLYGRKHEISCKCNKEFSAHKFIKLYPSLTELCYITESGVWFIVNYLMCNEGVPALATNSPVCLKCGNPTAKCLILSSVGWMAHSPWRGGDTAVVQKRQWVLLRERTG